MSRRLPALLGALGLLLGCRSAPAPAADDRPERAALPAAPAPPPPGSPPPPAAPRPPALAAPPVTGEALLQSGLRVVVVEHHHRPTVAFRLVLPRGSLTDPPSGAGTTLLAASLATDFQEQGVEGEELVEEKSLRRLFAERGGSLAVEVGADAVTLEATGYARDAPALLRLLAGSVTGLRHGARSFAGRRNGLLDLIEDLESWEPEALRELVAQTSFGPGHPYARPVHGTTASLTPLGLEDVVHHQRALFSPAGATLLIVGDVRAAELLREARTALGRWGGEPLPAPAVPPPAVPHRPTEVAFLRRQPAATLQACVTRPLTDVRGAGEGLEVLARVVGGGPASRLARAVREGSGLAYSADAFVIRRRQARTFAACATVAGASSEAGLRVVREALAAVRAGPLPDAEIERARSQRLAELETAWESSGRILETWTEALVLGGGTPSPERQRAELERVTPAEVRALAQKVLAPETLRWLLSGDRLAAARAVESNRLGQLAPVDLKR